MEEISEDESEPEIQDDPNLETILIKIEISDHFYLK
jgi:hypothetical protein